MMEPTKDRMRNNVSEPLDVEQRGDIFPARIGSSNRLGVPFRDVFIRAKFQGHGEFLDQNRGFHPAG